MLEIERERWRPAGYGWRERPSSQSGEAYSPTQMGEVQITELFKGRRYEDAWNIPASDWRPLNRHAW